MIINHTIFQWVVCLFLAANLIGGIAITSEAVPGKESIDQQKIISSDIESNPLASLNSLIDNPESFLIALEEQGEGIKQKLLPRELKAIQSKFLENVISTNADDFSTMQKIVEQWIDSYSKNIGGESLLSNDLLLETAISVKNHWQKSEPLKTISFNRNMIGVLKHIQTTTPPPQHANPIHWIGKVTVPMVGDISSLPINQAQPLFVEIKSLVEDIANDENTPKTARSQIVGLFANYVYAWGYPQNAKEILDHYHQGIDLSDMHPDTLRVYFYVNLVGLANREEASKYLKAVENYDFSKTPDSKRPRLFEMMSNAYYQKMGLSRDQLLRESAGFVKKQREIYNHIGNHLL